MGTDELMRELSDLKMRRADVLTQRSKATAKLERHETERGGLLLLGDKKAVEANARELASSRAEVADCDVMLSAIASRLVEVADAIYAAEAEADMLEANVIEAERLPAARQVAAEKLRDYQEAIAQVQSLQTRIGTLIASAGAVTKPQRRSQLIGGA